MPIDKGTHQGKLCSKNQDEAFCILKVAVVLIEKALMYIFSKIQLFEEQPCADPESYVRGWRADNGPTLNAGLVAKNCDFSGDLDQYFLETLFFCDFSGGPGPSPLDPPMTTKDQC